MLTKDELIKYLNECDAGEIIKPNTVNIVVAKKKKRGGYTVYPQVIEAKYCTVPPLGDCVAIIYEE
jgi:hypothetical protein